MAVSHAVSVVSAYMHAVPLALGLLWITQAPRTKVLGKGHLCPPDTLQESSSDLMAVPRTARATHQAERDTIDD